MPTYKLYKETGNQTNLSDHVKLFLKQLLFQQKNMSSINLDLINLFRILNIKFNFSKKNF